jgi:uncharacterized repeat protein (TIGR03803 family)
MKISLRHPQHLCLLVVLLGCEATSQTFTTLYTFSGTDGANPYSGLIVSNGTLYGTTRFGGDADSGTIFALNLNGGGLTSLHNFSGGHDGASPFSGLVSSGNALFGVTTSGGDSRSGNLFRVNTDGSGFVVLHTFGPADQPYFTNTDGGYSHAKLALSGDTLYGTAFYGGVYGNGTVFSIKTDGTAFATLHHFTGGSDGANPFAGLILSGTTLYGTASQGGDGPNGTVFKLNVDGTGFATLYGFTQTYQYSGNTNLDGASPQAALLLSSNTLYGTANFGGNTGKGTVFALGTDGTGFTVLHHFAGSSTNGDGAFPQAALILLDNTLYGTAGYGGQSSGVIFQVNTDGTGFATVHRFISTNEGSVPTGDLVLAGSALCGTTSLGSSSGHGTVFSLSLPVQPLGLAISHDTPTAAGPDGANVILTWPNSGTALKLQSATNLASPIWTSISQVPVVINGLNTVTNLNSSPQQFYRLSQ